jgi:cytochrome c oxidase subunit 2
MFSPHSPHARTLLGVSWYLFVVGGLIVIAVATAVVLLWLRNRSTTEGGADPIEPVAEAGARGERAVRWLGIYLPALILTVTFGVTIGAVIATANSGATPMTIDIVGRQWFWDVTYPGAGIRTANEIHIPVGTKVRLRLTSSDVVHSFWVPNLDRKMDVVPGHTNVLDIEADDPGTYQAECAEFCGIQHTRMRFLVVADTADAFQTWMHAEQQPSSQPSTAQEAQGLQTLLGSACAYCHTISGTNATGTVGPDLTHLGSRQQIGAGTLPNSPDDLGAWVLNPQHYKPGNHMPATDLDPEEIAAVVAYLESLK